MATTSKTAAWGQREPNSEIRFPNGVTLRTACGHSFVTCHTDRCFRLPPELKEQRDRLLAAAQTEHLKNVTSESRRYTTEKTQIEITYRNLAAEGEFDGWEKLL
jgi:hypothetical protein